MDKTFKKTDQLTVKSAVGQWSNPSLICNWLPTNISRPYSSCLGSGNFCQLKRLSGCCMNAELSYTCDVWLAMRAIFVMKMKTRITALRSASTKMRIMTICEMKTI